jgi:F-type H+-transporting ATPase subunit b
MTIDWWTLGIQTVNVAVLVWLLGRFFWRPVAALIEQRRATAQQTLDEAAAKRDAAVAALAEIERTRAGFAAERAAILAAAHAAAETARTARLAQAAQEAAALETAARAAIATAKEAADKSWAEQASRLAVAIAERLAARLDGTAVRDVFLDWLLAEIRRLPEPTRRAMAANGSALAAVSAAPLAPADQARYRARIGEACGGQPEIGFTADPTLIAGLELHGPHLVVSNSWRADLARILADIGHDAPHDDRP